MKLTIASITLGLASLAHLAVASDCTPNIAYCGYNLLAKDPNPYPDYAEQIRVQLMVDWQDEKDPDNINNSLFACGSRKNAAIQWIKKCKSGCVDGGPGQNDYCA
ncbi:hypothetical protein BCR34DRAFT_667653 [Clohesyomyces aquaticus]|uniref:Uncharacterized protein n=1 Tax=Clohesyomyces aquaticus TaxID=1231657 RepID=A0A1Y1YXX8_9PLEO|nr:hypothetical protein BCR34DRAFT_667653 [Clohesyomyces aquaticus]